MRVTLVNGQFVAEGAYEECAAWVYTLIALEREQGRKEAQKRAEEDAERFRRMLDIPFSELFRHEREEDKSGE